MKFDRQIRECTDLNNCGIEEGKPLTEDQPPAPRVANNKKGA